MKSVRVRAHMRGRPTKAPKAKAPKVPKAKAPKVVKRGQQMLFRK